jgi:hypothetical protein
MRTNNNNEKAPNGGSAIKIKSKYLFLKLVGVYKPWQMESIGQYSEFSILLSFNLVEFQFS